MGLERLPPVPWPTPPPKTVPASTPQLQKVEPSQPVINYRRILGGLAWPEEGHPGFICVLSELPIDTSKTFDVRLPTFEVIAEMPISSVAGLEAVFMSIRDLRCPSLFTDLDRKYYSFIRDFNQVRRTVGSNIHLKQTRSSSLEAALLKVKDMVGGGRLKFPTPSITRNQLSSFSKADLKDAFPHFAVRALAMVIDAFKPGDVNAVVTEAPRLSAWY